MNTTLRMAVAVVSSTAGTVLMLIGLVVLFSLARDESIEWADTISELGPWAVSLFLSTLLVLSPMFLVLRSKSISNVWSTIVAGVFSGIAGGLHFHWPHYGPEYAVLSSSIEKNGQWVRTMIDGEMTRAGWIEVLERACIEGAVAGAIVGVVFWLTWHGTRPFDINER